MEEEKKLTRKFIRVDTSMEAQYRYVLINKEMTGKALVMDLSGGGLKMLTDERIKEGRTVVLKMVFPDGEIEIGGIVVKTELDWYISDKGKKTGWTMAIRFEGLTQSARSRVINFVHRAAADRREAKLKKHKPA